MSSNQLTDTSRVPGGLDSVDLLCCGGQKHLWSLRLAFLDRFVFSLPRSLLARQLAHCLSGLAEAGYYPGLQYMIGSWYRKDEMAKRACILNASGSIAMLFSGFLMAGVTGLDGRGGLPGWKW